MVAGAAWFHHIAGNTERVRSPATRVVLSAEYVFVRMEQGGVLPSVQ